MQILMNVTISQTIFVIKGVLTPLAPISALVLQDISYWLVDMIVLVCIIFFHVIFDLANFRYQ